MVLNPPQSPLSAVITTHKWILSFPVPTKNLEALSLSAMDNATRNAGDLVDKLTITYNRSRQAAITKELIEIISGAESL